MMLSDVCLSDVCRVHHECSWRPQLLEARDAGRRRRKACMGWSWAAACGVQGRGHIVRPRAQLVLLCVSIVHSVRFYNNKLCGSRHNMPLPLQVDLLTLKVVSESRVTWATSVPILVFLGLSFLDLGPMYATDRRQTCIIT